MLNALDKMASSGDYSKICEWWKSQKKETYDDYLYLLDNFRVIFACNSNQIEGSHITYHTTRDIFEGNQLRNFNGTAIDIIETSNQKFAFEYMIEELLKGDNLSIPFILKLHKIMLNGCFDERRYNRGERPGKFKIHDYCVGMTSEGSSPEEVESDIIELLDEVCSTPITSSNLLKVASYLHLKFESIHPFADGNGRTGRTILNYFLMLNGHPPIVLYSEDRNTYYMALEVWDRTGQIEGFIKFLEEQTIKTWKNKL